MDTKWINKGEDLMYIGASEHTLDEKNRFFLPARFRKSFKHKKFIMTAGFDTCILLYPLDNWRRLLHRLEALPSIGKKDFRWFKRFLLSQAVEISLDAQNRVLIPKSLLRYAKIKNTVVVIGVQDKIEIWAKEIWHSNWERIRKKSYTLAEDLSI